MNKQEYQQLDQKTKKVFTGGLTVPQAKNLEIINKGTSLSPNAGKTDMGAERPF